MRAEDVFEPSSIATVYEQADDEPFVKEKGHGDEQKMYNKIKKSGGGADQSKKKNQ